MNDQTITEIAERFPWASWAVWDDAFSDGNCVERRPERLVEFVRNHATGLTPDVVLLGLNRADDLMNPFQNFHAPTRKHYDYRLKAFIQDGGLDRLHGSYMTDLVDDVNPDSKEVEVADSDASVLLEQLKVLGTDEYHIICFGNKPFDGLVRFFEADTRTESPEIKRASVDIDGLDLQLYRVWFYGLYGVYQDKVDTLERQLRHLNDQIV